VVHPSGREESIELQGVPFVATARRDGDKLVVVYRAQPEREVRYTYERSAAPPQLIVDVEFLEKGNHDRERLVYEPGVATDTRTTPASSTPSSASRDMPAAPAPGGDTRDAFDERPGAELKGLKNIGILVEDLGQQATACGLSHDALETALAKRLSDGGFNVQRNSDEDTYLYVNIITTSLPSGMCASRFDAYLYTHATAKLSYRDQPVLVQVSLIHRGGIGNSAPASHAAAVTRELEKYVDLFVTQIKDANK
jgi:hypothetical protein